VSFSWGSLRAAFDRSKASKSSRSTSDAARRKRFRRQFENLETRALLTSVAGDFNGDGIADLAIGIPTQTVAGKTNAGGVQILYGTPLNGLGTGLTLAKNRLFTRASDGVGGNPTAGDQFGAALAVGDFNRDGVDDLAVGSPGMNIGSNDAGGVYIFFGTHSGLRSKGSQLWTENSKGINGAPQAGAHFGGALAAGDFNRDGRIDLAIGAPNDKVGSLSNAGLIHIIHGGSGGLKGVNDQLWSQANLGANGAVAANNLFGSALAVGDFNADGFRDLAIGAPGQTVNGNASAGVVNVMYGSNSGLRTNNNQVWKASDLQGIVNANAQFGFSLDTGDVNDDSRSDLAIGAPGENVPAVGSAAAIDGAGAVHVMLGSSSRLSTTGNQVFHENTTGITNALGVGTDKFGAAVALGRLNGDRLDDLVIGAPGAVSPSNATTGFPDTLGGGFARVLYANGTGLGTNGTQIWHQNVSGIVGGRAQQNEGFGSSLAIADYNGDGLGDLAAEVAAEANNTSLAGSANVIFSANNGLFVGGQGLELNQMWIPQNVNNPEAFLATNRTKPGVVALTDGLQYKVNTMGTGQYGSPASQYTVNYTGRLTNGTVFDANNGATFAPTGVIAGFGEALLLMRVGDKWQVYIPSNLAYGTTGQGNIGPNEVLIFDLEVVAIS
jgi:hypothetical protein